MTLRTAPPPQGEEHQALQHGKTATRLLRTGLRIALLVGGRVGQLGRGAVHDLDGTALEPGTGAHPAVGGLGGGRQGLFQPLPGQTEAGLDGS